MFSKISWTQFLLTIFLVLFVYYVVLVFLYFRSDLRRFLAKYIRIPDSNSGEIPGNNFVAGDQATTDLFPQTQQLLSELKPVFKAAARQQYPKEELMLALQHKLQSHNNLYDTPFRVAVNNFLEAECSNLGSIHLENRDLERLWQRMELSSNPSF